MTGFRRQKETNVATTSNQLDNRSSTGSASHGRQWRRERIEELLRHVAFHYAWIGVETHMHFDDDDNVVEDIEFLGWDNDKLE